VCRDVSPPKEVRVTGVPLVRCHLGTG
jgi:hypothetical protein